MSIFHLRFVEPLAALAELRGSKEPRVKNSVLEETAG